MYIFFRSRLSRYAAEESAAHVHIVREQTKFPADIRRLPGHKPIDSRTAGNTVAVEVQPAQPKVFMGGQSGKGPGKVSVFIGKTEAVALSFKAHVL